MLFSEYLHGKTEEFRHNETISYLLVPVGSVYSVGGLSYIEKKLEARAALAEAEAIKEAESPA